MSEVFLTLGQMILEATPNAISSPESEDGATLSGSLKYPTTIHSGQAARPANHFPVPGSNEESQTNDTCGQSSSISSASADLQSSLASKLRARLPTAGSTIYKMTWKEKVTPAGRSLPRLAASALRTSGNDCSGWVTPQAFDATNDGKPRALRYKGNAPSEEGNTRDPDLPGSYRGELKDWAALTGWPTPVTADAVKNGNVSPRPGAMGLSETVALLRQTASGESRTGSSAAMVSGGRLNPNLSRWLMGYPQPWMDAAPSQESVRSRGLATPSSRKSPLSSSKP